MPTPRRFAAHCTPLPMYDRLDSFLLIGVVVLCLIDDGRWIYLVSQPDDGASQRVSEERVPNLCIGKGQNANIRFRDHVHVGLEPVNAAGVVDIRDTVSRDERRSGAVMFRTSWLKTPLHDQHAARFRRA
jgi:hypothetical protein